MTPPPPPFGQGPRVPPSHVPTLTEVIELGPDDAAGLSLEESPTDPQAWDATQPAALDPAAQGRQHAPAPAVEPSAGQAALQSAAAWPDLADVSRAGEGTALSEAPAGALLPLAASAGAPHGARPEPAAVEPAAPLVPCPPVPAGEPSASWRVDPDLPAFLLAGRMAAAQPSRPPVGIEPPGSAPVAQQPPAVAPAPASADQAAGADDLPVLSEALDQPPAQPPVLPTSSAVTAGEPPATLQPDAWREEQLVQQILADVQRHADAMLEFRLREALGPVLARVTDELVRGARQELAATLRDIVARAVAQELARQRSR